ncbi:hypothetical protein [Thiofilum flexile]|uniref:hypothetical protein n=1 Tax=Thiofilum flexile TaxID=125627 RepID=UPI000369A133|nr:hypothetical protein [Thiofilum flexile]
MKKAYTSVYSQLQEKLVEIDQITACLQPILANAEPERIWPIIQRQTLLLMTDDVVLATQARFLHRKICKELNAKLHLNLLQVEIKLLSLPLYIPARPPKRVKITSQTLTIMKSIASDIPDKDLGLALGRLAEAITEPALRQA